MGSRTRQLLPALVASLMLLSDTSAVVQGEIQTYCQRAAAAYNNRLQVQSPLPDLEFGNYVYVKPRPHRRGHAWSYGWSSSQWSPAHVLLTRRPVKFGATMLKFAWLLLHHRQLFHRHHRMQQQWSVHRCCHDHQHHSFQLWKAVHCL